MMRIPGQTFGEKTAVSPFRIGTRHCPYTMTDLLSKCLILCLDGA
jgi:hypothetical protein